MRPKLLKNEMKRCIERGLATFIWGPPGVGKSDLVKEIGADLEMKIFDNRASQMEPPDVRGFPFVNTETNTMHWAPPVLFPKPDGSDGPAILFLDELPQGSDSVQTALFQLCRDRRVGSYELPDGVAIVAAGNRAKDRSGARRVLSALNNRFVHFDFDVHNDDWHQWAISIGINGSIRAFLRWRPNLLNDFQPDNRAYPTPRTWEFLSTYFGGETVDPDNVVFDSLAGIVGEGAAGEFVAYLKVYDKLPNIDLIIKEPETAPVPDDSATLYALVTALADRANEETFAPIIKYATRIAPDYQVVLIKDSIFKTPGLISTPTYTKWAMANSDVLL